MSKSILILFLFSITLFACKSDKSDNNTPDIPAASSESAEITNKERRIVQASKWSFLTAHPWQLDGISIISDSLANERYRGQILKFDDDETYVRTQGNERVGFGKWTFDGDTKLLELFPEPGVQEKASQWNLKTVGDVLILSGTRKYENNNTQMKFIREFRAKELGK